MLLDKVDFNSGQVDVSERNCSGPTDSELLIIVEGIVIGISL